MSRRIRVLLVLSAAARAVAAESVDEARAKLRNGTVAEAKAAIETLVRADTVHAVKALQQGVENGVARLKKEQDDLRKKAQEHNRMLSTTIDLASKVSEMIGNRKDGTPEYKALVKKKDEHVAKEKKFREEVAAARRKVAASEAIVSAALPAFGRFRSDGAVEAIERIAAAKSGRVSRACTWALVRIGAPRSLPVLADVSRAADPGQRAMAARGLRMGEGGPPPELVQCLADKEWQVRYAAYDAAALGPLPAAIPLLIDAREKAKADEPRIDLLLGRLTGLAAPEPAPWKEWWSRNAEAVRSGTFRKADAWPPEPPEDPALAAVRSSRRLALVLACDSAPEKGLDADKHLLDAMRPEIKRAVAAIPDDATFGIVGLDSRAPARASDVSRDAALKWLDTLKQPPSGPLAVRLTRWFITEPEGLEDADTVLVVSAASRKAEAEAVDLLVAKLAEVARDRVFHCVGVGDSYDEDLLACVALQTGGAFVGGGTRFHAKVPAPGADRWTEGTVRVAAYRALKGREGERDALAALASIGEEAYPLLPMIEGCLGSDRPDDVRAEALAALGAMGPWAREALPRIEKLASDGAQVVADAARAALETISGE